MTSASNLSITTAMALLMAIPAAAQQADTSSAEAEAQTATGTDIVITASRTGATRLSDTPLAVTAFSQEMLDRTGLKDIRDLTALTPNLQVTQNASFSQVYIRGIGSNNVFGGSDPSSTIHVDGVYLARPASYLTSFLDVERIEVLRGPQGTLYGRNSVGGTINVVSRRPGRTMQARLQATGGNYGLARLEGYISGPVAGDTVAASLSLLASRRDGYLENVVPGVGDADDEATMGGRAQLRFTPSAALEIVLRADILDSDDALAGYVKLLQTTTDPLANSVLGDFRRIAVNTRPLSQRRQWGTSAEANYSLGGGIDLKSLTAYRANRLTQVGDTDGTALSIRRTDQFEDQHQFSQELNLTGRVGALTFILGGYYFDERIVVNSSVTTFASNVRANFAPVINTSAWAGFAQGTYALSDWLSVTGGIRYTRERKDFDQRQTLFSTVTNLPNPGFPFTYTTGATYDAWTPKVGVELRPAPGVLLYASTTKGFKSGGFNFSSVNPNQGFAPETLWSYEGGIKLNLFEQLLRFDAAYFHYDYQDLQVQSFLTPGVIDITNASDAKVDGVEIEAVLRPVRAIQIGTNVAYLDARYANYTSALLPGNIPFDASGNRLNLSPRWSYSLWAQADVDVGAGSLFARGEFSRRTRQFFTAANRGLDQQAPYNLVNASIGYSFPGDHFEVIGFARNLGDTDYVTSTASFASGIVGRVGEPRTYGLRLVAKY